MEYLIKASHLTRVACPCIGKSTKNLADRAISLIHKVIKTMNPLVLLVSHFLCTLTFQKIYLQSCVDCSIVYDNQDRKLAKCSRTDNWINKMVHIHIRLLLTVRKEESIQFTTIRPGGLESIMLKKLEGEGQTKWYCIGKL